MSLKLYEIDDELVAIEKMMDEWAAENEGDITTFPLNDEIERLQGERITKCLKVGAWIKNLLAESTAYKNEAKSLSAKARVCDNKAESLKSFLSYALQPGEKYKDSRVTLGWRKSKRVIVDALIDDLPPEYVKTTRAADLTCLKTALKNGDHIEGVSLQEFNNLSVS